MKKIVGRLAFMLAFFWLGAAFGVAAYGQSALQISDLAPSSAHYVTGVPASRG